MHAKGSTPEDTSKRDPLLHLALSRGQGSSDYIEGMEAEGQRELVNSTALPKPGAAQAAFEALGFSFGEESDELFVQATLPEGWTRAATDHAMHSDVLDTEGRRRVGVFYKAAFYDRSAEMHIVATPTTEAQRQAWEEVEKLHGWHYTQEARQENGDPAWATVQRSTDMDAGTATFYMRRWGAAQFVGGERDRSARVGYPWETTGPELYFTFALDGELVDQGENAEPTRDWSRF